MTPIPYTYRRYQTEDDYWRMREFFREVFTLNQARERSWHVSTLDYTRWHMFANCFLVRMEDVTHLWETPEGKLAAFALPIDPGSAHFHVHPARRSAPLEEAMLDVAEAHLSKPIEGGKRQLSVWATDGDALRIKLLAARGYTRGSWPETKHYRRLDAPIPAVPLAPGYTIRAVGDGLELLERCYASGLGFHDGDIRTAVDNRNDPTWYRLIQNAPLYRRDLDLVAVAPDGAIAAFCTVWFDDVTRSGVFEPVATVPEHQRKGLARAVITEGLRRLQRMGALTVCISGFSQAANALYTAVTSSDYEVYCPWEKTFKEKERPKVPEFVGPPRENLSTDYADGTDETQIG